MLAAIYQGYDWVLLHSFDKMGIISAAVTLLELNETVYVNWWGFPMCTKCSIKGCYHYCCHEYSWPLATYGHRDHLEIWFPHPTKGTHGCHGNTSKLAPRWAEETTDKGLRLSYIILRSITEAVSASSALRRENTHSKTDINKGILTIRVGEKIQLSRNEQ